MLVHCEKHYETTTNLPHTYKMLTYTLADNAEMVIAVHVWEAKWSDKGHMRHVAGKAPPQYL